MIYCYDYAVNDNIVFNSTKEVADVLDISIRSVQRGIQFSWVVKNRYLFDTEELPELEIKTKRPLPYYVLDIKTGNIYEFTKFTESLNFVNQFYSLNIPPGNFSKYIERKNSILKKCFVARQNDFSFIQYHRHHKKIKQISNDKITA